MSAADVSRSPGRSPPPPHRDAPDAVAARIGEDAFVAEVTVDGWVRSGVAVRAGALLRLNDGRCYVLRDAVRVIGRRNGDTDPYGFTGRVETLREVVRRGATLSADALRLGPVVYDVEYGFVAAASEARSA